MTTTYGEQRTMIEKKIDAELKARVERGLALLRETHGPNFADHINLKTLELEHDSVCVLGQLYGNYSYGVNELFDGSLQESVKHGFDLAPGDDANFSQLDVIWQEALTPQVTRP